MIRKTRHFFKTLTAAVVCIPALATGLSIEAGAAPATFEASAFANYKPDVANGEYMFNAAGCAACHGSATDPKLLSGGMEMRSAIGTFKVPNISAHPSGIGGWSNADFLNATMIGIDRNGDHLYPVMPYAAYAGMKPEDMLDIKAYIETLPQSDAASGEHEISFPFNQQFAVSLWKRANFDTKPYQPVEQSQMERGRYLVENVAGCAQCHSGRTVTFGLDPEKSYQGEKGLTGEYAPPIDRARMAGLASPDAFTKGVLVDGNKLNGSPLAAGSMQRISQGTANLTEEDRVAMYAYLANKEVKAEPQIAAASCAADTAAVMAGSPQLSAAADEFIGKHCRSCHGPGESAQGSFPAGDLASVASNVAFVTPGQPEKSRLYTSVTSGRMPYGKKPTAEETAQLAAWITSLAETQAAAAPAGNKMPERGRPIRSYADEIQLASTDIGKVDELDRKYIRYFTYRQQYNAVMGCESEDQFAERMRYYQASFRKLLNSLSYGPTLVKPKAVEGSGDTLVRVDLRDLKWTAEDWDRMISHYFYGTAAHDNPALETLVRGTGTVLPIVRTDWFMSNASRPPLYNEFLKLPDNIYDLESKMLRVDVNENIRNLNVVRAGFGQGASGVSDHNRMLERHDLPQGGYYWVSYDFAGDTGHQNLKRFPHGPGALGKLPAGLEPFEHDGGEMIFSLPNGMQGYYLSTDKGDKLDVGPTAIVSFRSRPIGKGIEITNGRSCFDCHANGIIAKRDEIRQHIETSPLFSIEQRDVLLKMYKTQEELDTYYEKDLRRFVTALNEIGAAEQAPDGAFTSLSVPGKAAGTELVTFYADLYEEDLSFEAVAAEFGMEPEQFTSAARRLRGDALSIAQDWIARLEGGVKIPRHEVEREFARMLEPLTGIAALDYAPQSANTAATTQTGTVSKPQTVAYTQTEAKSAVQTYADDRLKLAIKVASSYVKVGDKLKFTITANKDCELQLLYVESSGKVEIFPDAFIGASTLTANVERQIPPEGAGDIVFDEPANNETLIAFCKQGGLGEDRLTAEAALKLATANNQPVTRGISFQLAEKGKKNKGQSATQMVSFEVKK
jgi:mono/diheme cytochrome c family protein